MDGTAFPQKDRYQRVLLDQALHMSNAHVDSQWQLLLRTPLYFTILAIIYASSERKQIWPIAHTLTAFHFD